MGLRLGFICQNKLVTKLVSKCDGHGAIVYIKSPTENNKTNYSMVKGISDKIGLLWCHSHVELRLIEVEFD